MEGSEAKAEEVDQEVHRLIHTAHKKALQILTKRKNTLTVMAQALLEYETINGEEVDMIMKGAVLEDLEKKRKENRQALEQERQELAKTLKKIKPPKSENKNTKSDSSIPNPKPLMS